MASAVTIDFFGEDQAHELYARALAHRIAVDEQLRTPQVRSLSAAGGKGMALSQLKGWLQAKGVRRNDVLVVLVDANGEGWAAALAQVRSAIGQCDYPFVVAGCADPEIEQWCLLDRGAWSRAFGAGIAPSSASDSKAALRQAIEEVGELSIDIDMGVAFDLLPVIDLYAAGKESSSFKHFCEELRGALLRASRNS